MYTTRLTIYYICDKNIIRSFERRISGTKEAVISLSRQITPTFGLNVLHSGELEISKEIGGIDDLLLMPRYPPIDLTHSIFSLSAYNNPSLLDK